MLVFVEATRAQRVTRLEMVYPRIGVYLNPNIGRFWTMDAYLGKKAEPRSLHKYVYCQANPINSLDFTGHEVEGVELAMNLSGNIDSLVQPGPGTAKQAASNVNDDDVIRQARKNARSLADNALKRIMRWHPQDQSDFKNWFGRTDWSRRMAVSAHFEDVVNAIDKKGFKHQLKSSTVVTWFHLPLPQNGPSDALASTTGNHITFFDLYFKLPEQSNTDYSRAGVMLHEYTHLAWFSFDYAQGVLGAARLALEDPELAIMNAGNYECFAQEIRNE